MSTAKERLTAISGHVNSKSEFNCDSNGFSGKPIISPSELTTDMIESSQLSPSIAISDSIQCENKSNQLAKDNKEIGSIPYKR